MAFGSSGTSYDQSTVSNAAVEDLDIDAAAEFVRDIAPGLLVEGSISDALVRLRLLGSVGNRIVPTVAGLYCFGEHPQWVMPQLGVTCAVFDGLSITDPVKARDDLTGPLPRLLEGALKFVRTHSEVVVNQLDPTSGESEFAEPAIREALTNALVHRDLRAPGRIAVRIFVDRLDIWSPGGASALAEGIDTYASEGGVSLPRNPLVANVARRLGLVEQLGRGLPLIRTAVERSASRCLLREA